MTDTERIYGDAMYDVALESGSTKQILEELTQLTEVFASEAQFCDILATPAISKEERCSILDDCLAGKADQIVVNFLKVLTENNHIKSFAKCVEQFKVRYNEDNGIVSVKAVSAVPVSEELKEKLSEKIRSITGKTPEIAYVVDPNCIGGMLIDVEGSRFDATIRTRLDEMRKVLTK